jgi:hypothetical protein
MTELGESVFKAVEFLDAFFSDVSRLVTTVEEAMSINKLVSAWGTSSFWGSSTTYYSPTRWMPKYIARAYVQPDIESPKPDREPLWFTFFNVYFTPKRIQEPIAVWGVAEQSERTDLWQAFSALLIKDSGPDFLSKIPVEQWAIEKGIARPLASLKYRARIVVELNSAQIVTELVVHPLLEEIQALQNRV